MARRACISSIVRLVYSVRLTRAVDKTWASEAVCMWAVGEFTTVIIAGAFPTIPRLIQWLRGHKDSTPAHVQPYRKASKPSCVTVGNGLADVEAGHPGRGLSSVTTAWNSYTVLGEDLGRVGQGRESETPRDVSGKGLSVLSKNG